MKVSSILSPLVLCCLLALGKVPFIVTGFATPSRLLKRGISLSLIPTSQDIGFAPGLSSSSPPFLSTPTTFKVLRRTLLKAEDNTHVESRLNSALLAFLSSENDGSDSRNNRLGTNKRNFFASLDTMETLNGATTERSALLAKMIDEKKVIARGEKDKDDIVLSSSTVPTISYENPGSTETFLTAGAAAPVAEGTWKVVYAPHMTTVMDVFRGRFDVTYDLFPDSRIVSHAFYDFPVVGKGYLSVSGTYGSVSDDDTNTYSRVDFDKAWIKALPPSSTSSSTAAAPYESLEAVPDSFLKTIINEVGKRAFIESVAVFPVSFLDDDTIVFEFEFLGTKICAHKV